MTNAEKYLKDGSDVRKLREFREKLAQFIFDEVGLYEGTEEAIDVVIGDFLDMVEKPQLSEDERVILRNIDKKYSIIYRDSLGRLEIKSVEIEGTIWKISMMGFKHLFQFIKERRRIFY